MGMGVLMGAIGGAGKALSGYAEDEQKKLMIEKEKQDRIDHERMLMKERADMEVEKTALIEKMRAERIRESSLKQGSDIQEEVKRLQGEEESSAIKAKYGDNGSEFPMSPLNIENPENRKDLGLLNSKQKELERRVQASENLGYPDAARETRGQLQTEIQSQERKDERIAQDKRLDAQDRRFDAQLSETIRHNKSVEAAARERRGEDKLTPAAKVQLDIASSGINAAQRAVSDAARNLAEANKGIDDQAKIDAKAEYNAAKTEVTKAMQFYTETGRAHLGSDFKEIKLAEPPRPAPTADKIALLKANPDKASDFDAKYGEGSSAKYLKKETPQSSQIEVEQRRENMKQEQPKRAGIDVSNDPVLSSIRESLSKIDPNDPKDTNKMIAYGNAKNARIKQLQEKYGSMTPLYGM